jgi:carboxy-terminal domain RNA polymerase II polypeptide A small phosphatase
MDAADSLLVLDLDETLVHTREEPLHRQADLRFAEYHVYKRPHLEHFLRSCSELYRLALWSAGGADYVMDMRWRILPSEISPLFVWSNERCIKRRDFDMDRLFYIKDLNKTKRFGFSLQRTLLVEDTPTNCSRQYGNAVYVKPYEGDAEDDELLKLAEYLRKLHKEPNFRAVEKRSWRSQATCVASIEQGELP